jgi:WD40 repeat protein
VKSATFNYDGSRILTAYGTNQRGVGAAGFARVWDAQSGVALTPQSDHQGQIGKAYFNSNSSLILTYYNTLTRIWNAETGASLPALPAARALEASRAFGPDISLIPQPYPPKIWNLRAGSVQMELQDDDYRKKPIHHASFSPDGAKLVTVSLKTDQVKVWDVKAGRIILNTISHPKVGRAKFSPDGAWILTVSDDLTQVWDANSGHRISQYSESTRGFSMDGSHICSWNNGLIDVRTGLRVDIQPAHAGHFDNRESRVLRNYWSTKTVELRDSAPLCEPPNWLPDFIEALALTHFNEFGRLEVTSTDQFERIRTERLASKSENPWDIYARWLITPRQERTISPWSSIKVSDLPAS